MDVTAEAVVAVHDARANVHGLRFTYEPEFLRFFQARFEPVRVPHAETPASSQGVADASLVTAPARE
jgi:hypothetical protein